MVNARQERHRQEVDRQERERQQKNDITRLGAEVISAVAALVTIDDEYQKAERDSADEAMILGMRHEAIEHVIKVGRALGEVIGP